MTDLRQTIAEVIEFALTRPKTSVSRSTILEQVRIATEALDEVEEQRNLVNIVDSKYDAEFARNARLTAVVKLVQRGSPLAWPSDLYNAMSQLQDGDT